MTTPGGSMKVLVLDIETSPHLGHIWSLWDQNVSLSQLKEVGQVICWAAKWVGESKVHFMSDHHDGHEAMIAGAYELVDQADVIVTYNGVRFDMPHLKREFLLAGFSPPSPYKSVDLLQTVRREFKFASNKLDHVCQQLGLGGKMSHSGFDLWLGCMAGDEKSWRRFRQYNITDVRISEALYNRVLPWVANHPHHALYSTDGDDCCQNCGSSNLMRRGYARTNTARYAQLKCNQCGKYSRSKVADRTASIRAAA
jgi:DNA polymerase elongation subunit (family B)